MLSLQTRHTYVSDIQERCINLISIFIVELFDLIALQCITALVLFIQVVPDDDLSSLSLLYLSSMLENVPA